MSVEFSYYGLTFFIKPDTTTKDKYYCVMQNPFRDSYDTEVLYGGSVGTVQNKIIKQYKKFWKENI